MRWIGILGLAGVLVLTGAGCGTNRETAGSSTPAPSTSTPHRPSTPAGSATPWAALPGLGRCGLQPAELRDQHFRRTTLRAPGRTLPAVVAGRGRTVVLLVHQTDGGGLCGWLPFAARIAAVPGQVALAFDLCGYGEARCAAGNSSDATQQVEQVRLAIDTAAHELHARRVVVVGASMGGSLAVLTAAQDPRVDAAVDLSGPEEWRGVHVSRRAADVHVPLLVAMADSEGADAVAAARATAGSAAPGSEFAGADAGHGYELLADADGSPTPIAERVLAWIAAR